MKTEDSISLLLPAKTVWYRLIEFERWNDWFWEHITKDGKMAMGDTMRLLGGEGTEMRFGLFGDGVQKQTMRITEWDPPRRLTLALDGWNWKACISTKGKMDERAGKLMGTLAAISFSLTCEVTPVSDLETKLTFAMESSMTHPIAGPLLTLVYYLPWRSSMRRSVEEFTSRVAQSFESTKAA